jgi:HK97 family phage portal protein
LWGNGFARIDWLGNGAARALYPLMPWAVEPKATKAGARFYELRLPDGREDLGDFEVIHVAGLGYDGVRGMSVVSQMRDALGLAKAAETFHAKFLANGAKPGAILETPGRLNEAAQRRLAESLTEQFGRVEDSFKVLVLEQGAKLHTYTMPLKDAEFLALRKFQRSEVFGWFGLPPHLGGDTERSTSWGSGIEEQNIGFSVYTMSPLCVRIEQELNRKLFGRRSEYYCKLSLDGLQRGNFQSRMAGLQIAVGRPWMTANEARTLSDLNRMPDAGYDEIALPLNTGVGATLPSQDE